MKKTLRLVSRMVGDTVQRRPRLLAWGRALREGRREPRDGSQTTLVEEEHPLFRV